MTQDEVAKEISRRHFVGKYSYARLSRESGLSSSTIREAMAGTMSSRTQTRLEMLFVQLPKECHVEPSKRKPGKKKMYLIRYLNLRFWIHEIEQVAGKNPNFKLKKNYDLSTNEKSGYICTKLDYILKFYLLKIFGDELRKKKVYFGDCFSAEKWIDRIEHMLPAYKKDLIAKMQHRKGINNDRRRT